MKNLNSGTEEESNTSLHNQELENALLGLILLDNKNFEVIDLELTKDFFFSELNQQIFTNILDLLSKGIKADSNTLYYVLEHKISYLKNEKLKEYIESLLDYAIGSYSSIKEIVKILYFLLLKRKLTIVSDFVKDTAHSSSIDKIESSIAEIENKIFEVSNTGIISNDFKSLATYNTILKDRLESAMRNKKDIPGVRTSFRDLDMYTGGLQKSDLIIIAARPSMGKTALAITIARNVARNFIKEHVSSENNIKQPSVALFSLEMSGEQISTRIVAMESKMTTKAIHTGRKGKDNDKLEVKEIQQIHDAFQETSQLPIFIDDTPSLNVGLLRSRCRYLQKRYNVSVVIVDYLQLLRSSKPSYQGNRVLEIAEITQTLKAIAKELLIPVIALSQLSRAVEGRDDKKPQLSDLRESGTIEQDADIVMFLYRKAYYLEREEKKVLDSSNSEEIIARDQWLKKYEPVQNLAEVIVAKNRNGPIGAVVMHFNKENMEFSDHNEGSMINPHDAAGSSEMIENESNIPSELRGIFKKKHNQ